ncbi:MAG: VWA domain-containing protein [Candidatus Solibacter sp.]
MAFFMVKQRRRSVRPLYCTGMRIHIFTALALTSALLAQDPATIKVDVDVVSILASVRDKKGALIPSLQKEDFTVLEDGKPQTIKYFTKETDLPLTIGLLVDVSGSQRNLIDIERNAATQFFREVLRKKDLAFLISFGEETELLQDYTSSGKLLSEGLGELRPSSGVSGIHPGPVPTAGGPRGTVLYDAIYLAANEKLKGEVGRKVIVVITDGVDMGSRMSRNQAIEAAQKSDAVIYSINYSDSSAYGPFGMGGGGGEGELRKMSEETGGRVYKVDRRHTLDQVFKELQDEMRSQYSIAYTPTNDLGDGGYRHLEIKLANKDMKAQARKGYYAIKPGTK